MVRVAGIDDLPTRVLAPQHLARGAPVGRDLAQAALSTDYSGRIRASRSRNRGSALIESKTLVRIQAQVRALRSSSARSSSSSVAPFSPSAIRANAKWKGGMYPSLGEFSSSSITLRASSVRPAAPRLPAYTARAHGI